MVPLQNTHAANGIIEPDRVLLVSGALSDSSFGNASSALFDGQNFIPYIVSTSATGTPGIVSALIHSFTSFSFSQHRKSTDRTHVSLTLIYLCRLPFHWHSYSYLYCNLGGNCVLAGFDRHPLDTILQER